MKSCIYALGVGLLFSGLCFNQNIAFAEQNPLTECPCYDDFISAVQELGCIEEIGMEDVIVAFEGGRWGWWFRYELGHPNTGKLPGAGGSARETMFSVFSDELCANFYTTLTQPFEPDENSFCSVNVATPVGEGCPNVAPIQSPIDTFEQQQACAKLVDEIHEVLVEINNCE